LLGNRRCSISSISDADDAAADVAVSKYGVRRRAAENERKTNTQHSQQRQGMRHYQVSSQFYSYTSQVSLMLPAVCQNEQ